MNMTPIMNSDDEVSRLRDELAWTEEHLRIISWAFIYFACLATSAIVWLSLT